MSLFKNWPKLPASVNVAKWNKEKGVIAKLFKKKTEITEGIKAVDAANDKVQKAYFSDTYVVVDQCTKEQLLEHATEAKKEIDKGVKKFVTELEKLAETAKKRAAEFKKMPLAPKSAATYLATLERECLLHTMAIDIFTKDALKDIAETLKKMDKKK